MQFRTNRTRAALFLIAFFGFAPAQANQTQTWPQAAQSASDAPPGVAPSQIPAPDPSGDISTLATLGATETVAGSIEAGDVDCYRIFPLDRGFEAVLTPEPFGPLNAALFDRELRALDENGEVLAEKVEWADENDPFRVTRSIARQVWYLCVAGRFNGWVGDYRLTYSRIAP